MKKNEFAEIPTDPKVMRFNVELANGKTLRVQTNLCESGCFDYGNGTSVVVYVDEKVAKVFDTRYDVRCNTIEGYRKMMTEWVNDCWEAKEITQLC